MIRLSIRKKIMGIAVTLIILMAITAVLTMLLVIQVGGRIEDLTFRYIPAYSDLARANIRSLERGLLMRRIVIEKIRPTDESRYGILRNRFDALGGQIELEILAARALIKGLIEKTPDSGDAATLGQFVTRLDAINDDSRRRLNDENSRLLLALDASDAKAVSDELERIDDLREELDQKLENVRGDMMVLLRKDANQTVTKQERVMLISVALLCLPPF